MLIAKLQLCVYLSGLHLNIAKIVIEDVSIVLFTQSFIVK